jgi:5-methylcytosine-specific restriction endonuclease McrA
VGKSALRSTGSTYHWRKIRAKILHRDQYCCYYCGQDATTVDHLLPRSKGGNDSMDNLVAACTKCNYAKGGRFFVRTPTPPTPMLVSNPQNTSIAHDQTQSK